jgi:hypothetical protein
MSTRSNVTVDDLVRKTRRYEFADGLVDLQMSVILIALGVLSPLVFTRAFVRLGLRLAEALGSWAMWLTMLIVLLPAVIAIGTRRLVRYVRRRWLWCDSGFVEPLPSAASGGTLVLATALIVVGIVTGVILYRSGRAEAMLPLRMLVAGAGWAQGAIMIGVSRKTGMSRYAWLGVVGGLASTVFLAFHLSFGLTWLAFCLLWASAFAVSGLLSLRRTLLMIRRANGNG